MKIDQLIALLASLGACLSAVATFLTVRQIRKQSESSFRPDLTFSSTTFKGSPNPSPLLPKSLSPDFWTNEEATTDVLKDGAVATEFPIFSRFGIPLLNLGLGTAKNIAVSWSFPLENLVKQINELAQRTFSSAPQNSPLRMELSISTRNCLGVVCICG